MLRWVNSRLPPALSRRPNISLPASAGRKRDKINARNDPGKEDRAYARNHFIA